MNEERIKELGIQAGGVWVEWATAFLSGTLNLTRFVVLVRKDEREACARECAEVVNYYHSRNEPVTSQQILRHFGVEE